MTASPASAVQLTVSARKLFESDFYLALDTLRSEAGGPADTGRRFERLMRRAFETHPYEYGSERFERVWMWSQWPERTALGYGADIGIDLVAEQTPAYGGGLCAIQCKNYAEDHKVPTKGVDSFLAASGAAHFDSRILVVTSDLEQAGWTKVKKASPRCEVIGPAQLDSWDAPWREFLDRPDEFTFAARERHKPRPDQREALDAVAKGYQQASRGRLVMPCGTGKSLVAMWAAEENVPAGGTVLYLVPSIALMGQTMREWARNRGTGHVYVGVCSDKTTGRRSSDGDAARDLVELAMPVSTDEAGIRQALAQPVSDKIRVVFSTYQSLPVLASALPEQFVFDLVICDEAHRTTGVDTPTKEQVSAFRLIHDDERVPAQFRLFMTATQRIYTASAKVQAATKDRDVYSMDDEDTYGPLLYEMSFKDAVDAGLLSDYEVLVVATSQSRLTTGMSDLVAAVNKKGGKKQVVSKEDAIKLLGCWDALADPNTTGVTEDRPTGKLANGSGRGHLSTAIAFTNTVKLSQAIAGPTSADHGLWQGVAAEASTATDAAELLDMAVQHVDGSTPAIVRTAQLDRLRSDPKRGVCQVISNARVLTEGVDVPALDAVVFLQPRKSKIDIVQAVGRVMRTYPGKQTGYIVIPVVVPEGKGVTDIEVLDSSDFGVVWDVVRALRSHDERMDLWVNHIDAARNSDRFTLIDRGTDQPLGDDEDIEQLRFLLDERVASKMVERCGDRKMWPSWGARAAKVCVEVRKKVDAQLAHTDTVEAFDEFVAALRSAVGEHLTEDQAAEMVSQHVVTIPIFDCLFADSQFANANPISVAINNLLSNFAPTDSTTASTGGAALAMELFEEELRPLTRAYRTMRTVFEGALTAAAKVDVLREIYDGFFQAAMKDVVKRLGIVYTPVQIVDFIIRSADAVCRKEFGVGITSENVNILDPFTGTGTFIYRLLTAQDANGDHIIRSEDLHRKYYSELFANELVLLAYYIAAIKIEAGMAERDGFPSDKFNPFPGVTLSDTFLDTARQGVQLPGMADNIARQSRQGGVPITVIVMNPPWSAGQKSLGENNPKIDYPEVEDRIRDTYGKRHREVTGVGAGKSSGNLYVQAIRWASDRLGQPDTVADRGVIAMVHPNSLATGTTLAGMRAALRDEFTDIYVVNLRGDALKSRDEFDREGAKIFGQGSRNGVQITVLARNPDINRPNGGVVHYAAVPEYCTLNQKFAWLAQLGDVTSDQFTAVPSNEAHHWVNLTDGTYKNLMRVCATSREPQDELLTHVSAGGITTNCDPYVYAFDYDDLVNKVTAFIDAYDSALSRILDARSRLEDGEPIDLEAVLAAVTTNTPASLPVIKWTARLKNSLRRGDVIEFDAARIRQVMYRPYTKLWLYSDARILDKVTAVSSFFPEAPPPGNHLHDIPKQQSDLRDHRHSPTHGSVLSRDEPASKGHPATEAMMVSAPSPRTRFSALAHKTLPDLHLLDPAARSVPRRQQSR